MFRLPQAYFFRARIYNNNIYSKTKPNNTESQEHLFSFILGQEEGTGAVVCSMVLSVFSEPPREASICLVGVMMSKTLQGQNWSWTRPLTSSVSNKICLTGFISNTIPSAKLASTRAQAYLSFQMCEHRRLLRILIFRPSSSRGPVSDASWPVRGSMRCCRVSPCPSPPCRTPSLCCFSAGAGPRLSSSLRPPAANAQHAAVLWNWRKTTAGKQHLFGGENWKNTHRASTHWYLLLRHQGRQRAKCVLLTDRFAFKFQYWRL